MPVALRPALNQDFDYCRRLYFAELRWIIEKLLLDEAAQEIGFQKHWDPTQVRIITLDGVDIGWLQAIAQDDELFVAQILVDRPFQRRGIGTQVMKRLIGQAAQLHQTVRLHVMKINPARRLYERLGFEVTYEDDHKFYMKLDASIAGRSSH
jgi:ribosomal protein S18 acetylase RimI-like enzyme